MQTLLSTTSIRISFRYNLRRFIYYQLQKLLLDIYEILYCSSLQNVAEQARVLSAQ